MNPSETSPCISLGVHISVFRLSVLDGQKGFLSKDIESQGRYSGAYLGVRVLTGLRHPGFVMTRMKKCRFGISKQGSTLWRVLLGVSEEKQLMGYFCCLQVNYLCKADAMFPVIGEEHINM